MTTETATIENNLPEASVDVATQPSGFLKWAPLVVLALALAIIILDTTILNVSLRTIIGDLHTDIRSIQWVITAYALMLAAFTITGGRLGDLFGRKKMFVVGAIIFAIGSFITSISYHVGIMIVGEAIIEGIGACLMMPATASLLLSNYKGRDRALAFGVWGGIAAASAALGPVVGGWLTTHYSWRWAFRINIGVALVLILGSLLIKEAMDTEEKPELDFVGIILSSLGLLSMVYGFIEASSYGWLKAKEQLVLFGHTLNLGTLSVTPLFVILGIIILGFFALWQKHRMNQGKTPLVSLKLFRNRQFVIGSMITAIMSIGMAGLSFSIPVFLQGVRNLDPLHTGLAMLPMPMAIFISAPLSAFIVKYIQPKRLIQIALIIASVGFIVLYYSLKVDATVWSLAPGFAIFGFGMGFMFAQLSNLTLSAVSVQESGEASGVNNTFRQLGQTLGSAILGTILISSLGSNLISGVQASQVIPDQAKSTISTEVSQQASSIEFGGSSSGSNSIPAVFKQEITNIAHVATTDASRDVTVYGVGFLLLAFLFSFRLSGSKDIEIEESVGVMAHDAMMARDPENDPVFEEVVNKAATDDVINDKIISIKAAVIAVAGVVVIGGTTAGVGYYAGKNKAVPPVVVVQSVAPQNLANNNSVWTPLFNPTVPPTSVTPDSVAITKVAGDTTTVPVAVQTYADNNLKFSINVPADWKIQSKNTEVTMSTPDHHSYSIQSYIVGNNNNDLEGLQTFLNQQPNLRNSVPAIFNGYNGFSFVVVGYYKQGYALLSNGRLYYILGTTMSDSALSSFKIAQ